MTEAEKLAAANAAEDTPKDDPKPAEGDDPKPNEQNPNLETNDDPKPADGSDPKPADAEDDPAEGADDGDKDLDTSVWGDTGDKVGNSVLSMLQNGGMTPDEAKAMIYDPLKEHGDVTKLDQKALAEKIGEDRAALVMAGIENFSGKIAEQTKASVEAVHGVMGGKENWDKVLPWAKKNIPADALGEYADMIDQGGAKARFAAQEILGKFNADTANTSINGSSSTLEGDTTPADSGRKITAKEYADELNKAHKGNAKKAVFDEIQAARVRGRKAGI